jgi:RimJ/RimL family protein N-acetyltransferase
MADYQYNLGMSNIITSDESNRIRLVALSEAVIDQIIPWVQSAESVGSFFSISFRSRSHFLAVLKSGDAWSKEKGYCAVYVNDELMGIVWWFSHGIENSLELGVNIFNPTARGRGIGTGSVNLLVNLLFTHLPVRRLQYNVARGNLYSRKLALKLGFTYEGIHREGIFVRGSWLDLELYSILRRDFHERNRMGITGNSGKIDISQ